MIHAFTLQISTIACLMVGILSTPVFATPHRIHETEWKPGVIILSSAEVLNGDVYYNHLHDLLLLRSGDHKYIKTFTVNQVRSFQYYDQQDNIIHHFLALSRRSSSYMTQSFYEVVTEGEVLYLRQRNRCPLDPPPNVNSHAVAYHYFAYYRGRLVRAHRFKQELLPTLVAEDPTLSDYIKEHQLKPYHVGDQILLIDHFNHQSAPPIANLWSS